jgi:hypothetical protein
MFTMRRLERFALPLALLVSLLASGELILRTVGFAYPPSVDRDVVWNKEEDGAMRAGTSLNTFDAATLWSPRPGARVPWTKEERINAAGYRGPLAPIERTPGVVRIVTLGSCSTFGRGVAYEDTYSALLERRLRERGLRAEVLDGGVVGATVVQGAERYHRVFHAYRPDVVISSFCGYKEHECASRLQCDRARLNTWRAHPDHVPRFAHHWSARRDLRLAQLPIWMLRVIDGTYWNERSSEFDEQRSHAMVKDYDAPVVRRVGPDEFMDALGMLEREVRADGGHLMLVNVPNNLMQAKQSTVIDAYAQELRDFSDGAHLLHVDGASVMRRAVREGADPADLFDAEGFPSPCAHDLLAQALADEITARRLEYLR